MRTNDPSEQIKALVKQSARGQSGRYRLRNTVAMTLVAVLGLQAEELADLTVADAEAKLLGVTGTVGKLARALLGKLVKADGLVSGDLVIRSRKGGKRVGRVTVWRIVVAACGAGLRFLHQLFKALTGQATESEPPTKHYVESPKSTPAIRRPRFRSLSTWANTGDGG